MSVKIIKQIVCELVRFRGQKILESYYAALSGQPKPD